MPEGKSEYPADVIAAAREAMNIVRGDGAVGVISRAILAERRRCEEVARTWEQTAKKVGQIEGEGVARDIRLCIAAGIPAPPSSTEES